MGRDWETTFRTWATPPSQTEQDRQANAERMIRDAIRASTELRERSIQVFAQGSYRNHTNVRLDSDVDIGVLCLDFCYTDFTFAKSLNDTAVGLKDANYPYRRFKDEVERALVAKFGRQAVRRGNKAFDVHENSYRVEADVVPCFEHRRYHVRSDGTHYYESGTAFRPDSGGRVVNWPEQQYANGVAKNRATGGRFKALVRVMKRLSNEMTERGISAADVPSYLIECLVWNVPDDRFGNGQYRSDARNVLAFTFNNTLNDNNCHEWGEVNERKYLFRPTQPWTRSQAHAFLDAAWDYVGFE